MENYRKLPARLKRFAELVAGGETAAHAVRMIRPRSKCPNQQGCNWRRMPKVAAAIEELQAEPKAAFERRYARHLAAIYNRANADRSTIVAAALLGAEAVDLPKDPREWPQELKDCIEGVKFKDGLPEITLSDRNTASRLFSQHVGWIAERHELTGRNGERLSPRDPAAAAAAAVAIAASNDPVKAASLYQELMGDDE